MSNTQSNAKIVATCGQRITALNKLVTSKAAMKINGQPMKLSDVIAVYQANVDARAELITQRAALTKALSARESAEATRQATDVGLKAWVIGEFGASSTEAQEFGFGPSKVAVKSAETKAKAVKKLRATREARMTLGKRQRKDIKGAVPASTEPAVPANTAPAASSASAPASTNVAPNGASPANGAAASH